MKEKLRRRKKNNTKYINTIPQSIEWLLSQCIDWSVVFRYEIMFVVNLWYPLTTENNIKIRAKPTDHVECKHRSDCFLTSSVCFELGGKITAQQFWRISKVNRKQNENEKWAMCLCWAWLSGECTTQAEWEKWNIKYRKKMYQTMQQEVIEIYMWFFALSLSRCFYFVSTMLNWAWIVHAEHDNASETENNCFGCPIAAWWRKKRK